MNATLSEQSLGSVRWLVVSGQAGDCFRALGRHMRAEIREAVTEWDATRALRARVATSPGRERFAATRAVDRPGGAAPR